MGKLFTALKRVPKRTGAAIAIVAAAVIIPATLFAWGPSRPTYTIEHPADHVTFDSITNNPNIGDERNFVGIREAGTSNLWEDNMQVQPGKAYTVRMYVHNNAASNLNLVAQDVTARFNLPTTTGKSIQVDGSITSSNANPNMVYDDAVFNSNQDFNLTYVAGSLKYENNAFGAAGTSLPESIFTQTGALLGYNKLDGKIPGCFQYAGYVTFTVKPQFAPKGNFEMSKQVRKAGDTTWQKTVAAKPGDTLEYELTYKNTGATRQNNVVMQDTLPAGLTYVNGSSYLKNGTNPNGIQISDNVTKPVGVNIGDYEAGAAAYVKFSAKVADNDALPVCGPNTLTNKGRVTADNESKDDTANATVPKECQPPVTPKYTCDALTVTKIDRTNFKFDTKYTVENATFKSVTYVVRDENGTEIARTTNPNYTQDKVGKYTVEAIVTVTVNGQDKTATSENCKKPFEVTEIPVTPVYTCDSLTVTKIDRTNFKFDTKYTVQNATFKSVEYVIRDASGAEIARSNSATYTQDKPADYSVQAIVTVTVNGQDETVTSDNCKKPFTVTPPNMVQVCNPETGKIITVDEKDQDKYKPVGDKACQPVEECKPGIPTGDSRCEDCTTPGHENNAECVVTPPSTPETPTELPHTGTSDSIIALIGAGSLIASVGYYVASRRSLS